MPRRLRGMQHSLERGEDDEEAYRAAVRGVCRGYEPVRGLRPLTGDTSNMGLWIAMVVVAVIAVVVLLIVGAKKKKK